MATLSGTRPFCEFGIVGVDKSFSADLLREVFAPLPKELAGSLQFVPAFCLGYQGLPWAPTSPYAKEGYEGRRFDGRVYPSWDEIDNFRKAFPKDTPASFHLNNTNMWPCVSDLLGGKPEMCRCIATLVEKYNAKHIQINLNGLPSSTFAEVGSGEAEAEQAAEVLLQLCREHKNTTFLVSITEAADAIDKGVPIKVGTLPLFKRLLAKGEPPTNLAAFFDCSGGYGKEPDAVAELPAGYPVGRVGFTGGIKAENAKTWLDRYAARAAEHGCGLISDAQSCFRQVGEKGNRERGLPVDEVALRELVVAISAWAAEHASRAAAAEGWSGCGKR